MSDRCLVCEIVFLKVDSSLSFEKRLEFKQNGRPLPELALKQVTHDKNKSLN